MMQTIRSLGLMALMLGASAPGTADAWWGWGGWGWGWGNSYYTGYAPYSVGYGPSYYAGYAPYDYAVSYGGTGCCAPCGGCSTCGNDCAPCGGCSTCGTGCSTCGSNYSAGCATCGGAGCANCVSTPSDGTTPTPRPDSGPSPTLANPPRPGETDQFEPRGGANGTGGSTFDPRNNPANTNPYTTPRPMGGENSTVPGTGSGINLGPSSTTPGSSIPRNPASAEPSGGNAPLFPGPGTGNGGTTPTNDTDGIRNLYRGNEQGNRVLLDGPIAHSYDPNRNRSRLVSESQTLTVTRVAIRDIKPASEQIARK